MKSGFFLFVVSLLLVSCALSLYTCSMEGYQNRAKLAFPPRKLATMPPDILRR